MVGFFLFPVIARWLKSIKKKLSEEIVKDIFRCTDYIVLICIPYIYGCLLILKSGCISGLEDQVKYV